MSPFTYSSSFLLKFSLPSYLIPQIFALYHHQAYPRSHSTGFSRLTSPFGARTKMVAEVSAFLCDVYTTIASGLQKLLWCGPLTIEDLHQRQQFQPFLSLFDKPQRKNRHEDIQICDLLLLLPRQSFDTLVFSTTKQEKSECSRKLCLIEKVNLTKRLLIGL